MSGIVVKEQNLKKGGVPMTIVSPTGEYIQACQGTIEGDPYFSVRIGRHIVTGKLDEADDGRMKLTWELSHLLKEREVQ